MGGGGADRLGMKVWVTTEKVSGGRRLSHTHWEFESECPHCGTINHVKCPVGETVVVVECMHCPHSYQYLHVVDEHEEIDDELR